MTKIFENSDQVQEARIENKPSIFNFNFALMKSAAKATLNKPMVARVRTSNGSGNSEVTQAIINTVAHLATLGTTQVTMSLIKENLSNGGADLTNKAIAKKISDYVWNLSERNKNLKSVALLTLVKDASGNILSGIYGINMSHPSVVDALNKAQAEDEVAE